MSTSPQATPNQNLLDNFQDFGTEFYENRLELAKSLFSDFDGDSIDTFLVENNVIFDCLFAVGLAFDDEGKRGQCNAVFSGTGESFIELFNQLFRQSPEWFVVIKAACDKYENILLDNQPNVDNGN